MQLVQRCGTLSSLSHCLDQPRLSRFVPAAQANIIAYEARSLEPRQLGIHLPITVSNHHHQVVSLFHIPPITCWFWLRFLSNWAIGELSHHGSLFEAELPLCWHFVTESLSCGCLTISVTHRKPPQVVACCCANSQPPCVPSFHGGNTIAWTVPIHHHSINSTKVGQSFFWMI